MLVSPDVVSISGFLARICRFEVVPRESRLTKLKLSVSWG